MDTPQQDVRLPHGAAQLLKSLRAQSKINVTRIGDLERGQPDLVLVDSGATHALRSARDMDEWLKAEPTVVMLAEGSTSRFSLKHGTKILLSEPGQPEAWIVPMGGLTELDFTTEWTGNQFYNAMDWKPIFHSRWWRSSSGSTSSTWMSYGVSDG